MAERGLVRPRRLLEGGCCSLRNPFDASSAERAATAFAKGWLRIDHQQRLSTSSWRACARRNIHPVGHTRLPRYVRGHGQPGDACALEHVLPDSNAAGLGGNPQWLYPVRFEAMELWGEGSGSHDFSLGGRLGRGGLTIGTRGCHAHLHVFEGWQELTTSVDQSTGRTHDISRLSGS